MGRPLFDDSRVASSWITSQCSASTPSTRRRMSAAIQAVGWPNPENRSWIITRSPSATIIPGSYFSVGGDALDQIEQAFASGRDVSAVLDVVGRPEALSSYVVTLTVNRPPPVQVWVKPKGHLLTFCSHTT